MRFFAKSAGGWALALCTLAAATEGCSGRPSRLECEKAVLRYWDGRDIAAYFSQLSLGDAVTRCERDASAEVVRCAMAANTVTVMQCAGVASLPIDPGWESGLHCFVSSDDKWSRCERSNRECAYYRHVARRGGRNVSQCQPAAQAWAIRRAREHVNPAPSASECERIRADLIARGHLEEGASCERVTYEELLAEPRKRAIAEPSAM